MSGRQARHHNYREEEPDEVRRSRPGHRHDLDGSAGHFGLAGPTSRIAPGGKRSGSVSITPGPRPATSSHQLGHTTMNSYITDRGIQASAATAVVLGVTTVIGYSPALLAVWAVWAGVTGWAITVARGKRRAA